MIYDIILRDMIWEERLGKNYRYTREDKKVLKKMLKEINPMCGRHFKYFAELDHYYIEGAGEIVKKYIDQFPSEGPKAILLEELWRDKLKGCDEKILDLYLNFRKSPEYIPTPEMESSAYIYVKYDNAFVKMHSKNIEDRLIDIIKSPRDANILTFTETMLTKRRPEEMKDILINRINDEISAHDLGMEEESAECYHPSYGFIISQLKYSALGSLKYCDDEDVIELLKEYINGEHKGYSRAAKKSYEYIINKRVKKQLKKP